MESLRELLDVVLHLDRHLNEWAGWMGSWLYVLLFAIVFCETGLVVTPFLPGDSLLFVAGAIAAAGGMNIHLLVVLLIIAAVLGDAAWRGLFSTGHLDENPGINMTISTRSRLTVVPERIDQLGNSRPTNSPADIGAIEAP